LSAVCHQFVNTLQPLRARVDICHLRLRIDKQGASQPEVRLTVATWPPSDHSVPVTGDAATMTIP
jgi:hypothetical protein